MEVFRRLPPIDSRQACALTIGNFDGVHLGHQALLNRLKATAKARNLASAVLTFEPHPREYFASLEPQMRAPARIYGERDKIDAMTALGIERVCIAHFNAALASQSAEHFVEQVLIEGLQARHLLIGDDFRFGAKRAGDFALLEHYASQGAFTLERMDTFALLISRKCESNDQGKDQKDDQYEEDCENHLRVSSSLVREALASANFERAALLLGRPYCLSGHVIHGQKLGRTLGFPTLNLRVPSAKPAIAGIFAVKVHELEGQTWDGVASLGTRPAVESDGRSRLEVHVFDYAGDAYGKLVRIEFIEKIRDEAHYESLDLLTAQINRDAQSARAILAGVGGTVPSGSTPSLSAQPARI